MQAHGEIGVDRTPQLQIVAMGTDGTCSRMRREALLSVMCRNSYAVSTHRWQKHLGKGAFVDALRQPQPNTRMTRAIRLVRAQAARADPADAQPGSFALCEKQHADVALVGPMGSNVQRAPATATASAATQPSKPLICCSCGARQRNGKRFPMPLRKTVERERCTERASSLEKRQRANTQDTQPKKKQARGQ